MLIDRTRSSSTHRDARFDRYSRPRMQRHLDWIPRQTLSEIGSVLEDQQLIHLILGRDVHAIDHLLADGAHLLERQFGPRSIQRWAWFATGYATTERLPVDATVTGIVAVVEEHWRCHEILTSLNAWISANQDHRALLIELVDPFVATVCTRERS